MIRFLLRFVALPLAVALLLVALVVVAFLSDFGAPPPLPPGPPCLRDIVKPGLDLRRSFTPPPLSPRMLKSGRGRN